MDNMPDIPKMPMILSFLARNNVTLGDVRGKYNIRYFVSYGFIFIKLVSPCYITCYKISAPKFSDINKTSIDLIEFKRVANIIAQ